MAARWKPPKRIGPGAGADSRAYRKTWERPDNKPSRPKSLYVRRPAVGCMVRVAILRAGGRVKS